MANVRADDIPSKIRITGRLGIPLGEMMTICGQWRTTDVPPGEESKDDDLIFRVISVNGNVLGEPIDFSKELLTRIRADAQSDASDELPREGEWWQIRGIETGGMRDLPGHFWNEIYGLPDGGDSPVAQRYGFRFVTELVHGSVTRLEGGCAQAGKGNAAR